MQISVMFFSSTEATHPDGRGGRYRLVLEAARHADRAGLTRIWLPERHYVQYGALHPNPAVLAAALARETHRIRLAAGSVVLPLHHPLSVVEQWAMVDNLSDGRVDLAFATGWLPDDFALAPDIYYGRKALYLERTGQVLPLWQGASHAARSGDGRDVALRAYPTPVQAAPGLWLAAARAVETMAVAGAGGFNLLTALVDLRWDGLAAGIAAYRAARAQAGHPGPGHVTVMMHTAIGAEAERLHAIGRAHHLEYLLRMARQTSVLDGLKGLHKLDLNRLHPEVVRAVFAQKVDQIWGDGVLVGTLDQVLPVARRLAASGVDEVACLIDFIEDMPLVLECLPGLEALQAAMA